MIYAWLAVTYGFFGLLLVELARSSGNPPVPLGVVVIVFLWPVVLPMVAWAVYKQKRIQP